jgi:hypothetical protein
MTPPGGETPSASSGSSDIQMALRAGREAVQRQIAALRDATRPPDGR